jgi:hypothetical protein
LFLFVLGHELTSSVLVPMMMNRTLLRCLNCAAVLLPMMMMTADMK